MHLERRRAKMSTVAFFILAVTFLRSAVADEPSSTPEGLRSVLQIFELKNRLALWLYDLHVALSNVLWCGSTECPNFPMTGQNNESTVEPQVRNIRESLESKRLGENCNSINRQDAAICDVSIPNDRPVAETSADSEPSNPDGPAEGRRIHTRDGTKDVGDADSTTPEPSTDPPMTSEQPSTTEYPSTTPRRPRTTPRVPSTTPRKPSTTPRVPSTTPRKPSTTPRVPSTTPRKPSTTPRVPSTTPRKPSTTPRVPSTTPRKPSTTPRVPSTTPRKPSTTDSTPTTPAPCPPGPKMDGVLPPAVKAVLPEILRAAINPLSGAGVWNLALISL